MELFVKIVAQLLPPLLIAAEPPNGELFEYDPADETVHATVLDDPNAYDAGIVSMADGIWLAWLKFVPGKGDQIWVGCRQDDSWRSQSAARSEHGRYANPTLTVDSAGQLWLSYEAEANGQWDVFASRRDDDGKFSEPCVVSTSPGPDINHRVAADKDGGLWFAWQGDRAGQFDILARRVTAESEGTIAVVSEEPYLSGDPTTRPAGQGIRPNDWHPDLTVAPDGTLYVAWDAFTCRGQDAKRRLQSYDIYARAMRDGRWSRLAEVTLGEKFETRPRIVAAKDGRVWVFWQQGEENWGEPYRGARGRGGPEDTRITDAHGPVHRFRFLRFGLLELKPAGDLLIPYRTSGEAGFPMPSVDRAAKREKAPDGVRFTGAFYERGEITLDRSDRLWVVYRHYYTPWMGIETHHHIQGDWGVYARCLTESGWSKLLRMDVGQGDGMQQLHVVPHGDGVAAVWTTGRTDRRETKHPRGLALATFTTDGAPPGKVEATMALSAPPPAILMYHQEPRAVPVKVAGRDMFPVFGDLHRHTDLSLCFVPSDGTIDDAYRYAMDVAQLDFLGITDHTHDLVMGDPLSQVWWRSTKEVTRHELKPNFFPIYSYERSRGDTDHNVFSLRPDMLRPHTYPHPDFWKELDGDTFTIAHQPVNPKTWDSQDNAHRPLVEVFQGFRDRVIEKDAQQGLSRGYLLGFIASSDHLSTSASFAGVWAEDRTRESIFRALQARRTFGATARIRLLVRAGEHCMGEAIAGGTAAGFPQVQIDAEGTAPIDSLEIIVDGDTQKTLAPATSHVHRTRTLPRLTPGPHYFYVRLQQSDGNQAWSSPIWVNVE